MNEFDVIVIGGGPAGMMAAGRAAEGGAHVCLLEKNESLGKKLLITGGGRCNITNATFDSALLLKKYGSAEPFLHSPFSKFNVQSTFDFFQSRGLQLKIEGENRAFPITDTARSVWEVMCSYIKKHNVEIRCNSSVKKIEIVKKETNNGTPANIDTHPVIIHLKNGKIIRSKRVVIATGGMSHPETGSTGEGFKWLADLGHTITTPNMALVPIKIQESWVHNLSGVSLSDAKLSIIKTNNKIDRVKSETVRGKILYTHFGISGPASLNLSTHVSDSIEHEQIQPTIEMDIFPHLDYAKMDATLQKLFSDNSNKTFGNILKADQFLPTALAETITILSNINPNKKVNTVSRDERISIMKLLKHLKITATGVLGDDKAIVSSGGVSLKEIDFKTMQSRIHPELFLVGDVLDIDRPSGGYSLQLCWTTGFVAGSSQTI